MLHEEGQWCELLRQDFAWLSLSAGEADELPSLSAVAWPAWVHLFGQHCHTEFWSAGRLAAHLRSSDRCLAQLRKEGRDSETVQPGFGRRARRQQKRSLHS